MSRNIFSVPKQCPNAVATERGWVDPKTNELLVSYKGLKSYLEKNNKSAVVVPEPIEVKEVVTVEIHENPSEVVEPVLDPIEIHEPKKPVVKRMKGSSSQ